MIGNVIWKAKKKKKSGGEANEQLNLWILPDISVLQTLAQILKYEKLKKNPSWLICKASIINPEIWKLLKVLEIYTTVEERQVCIHMETGKLYVYS